MLQELPKCDAQIRSEKNTVGRLAPHTIAINIQFVKKCSIYKVQKMRYACKWNHMVCTYLCLAFFALELKKASPGGFYNCLNYILGLLLNFVFIFNSLLHAEYILCMI